MTKKQNFSNMILSFLATLQFWGAAWAAAPAQFIAQGGRNDLSPDGSFIYSFGRGTYPLGAYLYRSGSPDPLYTRGNGDWVEHARRLPGGRVLLNTSKDRWLPAQGVKSLKRELYALIGENLTPLTDFGQVTSDFGCHADKFCVVQVADLSDPDQPPQLYRVALEKDSKDHSVPKSRIKIHVPTRVGFSMARLSTRPPLA